MSDTLPVPNKTVVPLILNHRCFGCNLRLDHSRSFPTPTHTREGVGFVYLLCLGCANASDMSIEDGADAFLKRCDTKARNWASMLTDFEQFNSDAEQADAERTE